MRFSFSTKGWHGVSWQEFVDPAADLAFEGIEIHNLCTELADGTHLLRLLELTAL